MNAQLGFCSGNSGEAIFSEDFGTAPSSSVQYAQLPFGTTTYNFRSGLIGDGDYHITNRTNDWGTYGWFQIGDHTVGDTNGRMLVVNADFTPGEFYRTTISGLCENTSYEFSSWMINVTMSSDCSGSPIPINVRFEIWDNTDTTLLASGDTGSIPGTSSPIWQQYALVFRTIAAQTSVILKMRNNGVGGCGNDLAIDDIVFKSCGDSIAVEDTSSNTDTNICITQTPYSTTLNALPDNSVFSSHFYQWQQSSDGINWVDIPGETGAALTINGIVTNSSYRTKVAEDVINVNNSSCNTLSDIYEITVNNQITPSFDAVGSICSGQNISPLPAISNEGITGTWSPAIDTSITTLYTFTPDAGQCATTQTMMIVVNPIVTPTFNQVSPICIGDTLNPLPTTSLEGVTGSWSPMLDNMNTTTYTFTPDAGECAVSQTMTITVNQIITPTFNQVAPICNGDVLAPLPTTSIEGVLGIWSHSLDNMTTTTYTFTPNSGECATTQTMTIEVNPIITPTFTQIDPICTGTNLNPLPTLSNEGIMGTWSPSLNIMNTTTYTFTPDLGQCAVSQTMTITVNPNELPVFNQIPPICFGETLAPLPGTSINGITGVWSPELDSSNTTTYTFTPDPGFCPTTVSLTIEVNPLPAVNLEDEYYLCTNAQGAIESAPTIDTGLSSSRYQFRWYLDSVELQGVSSSNYLATSPGLYEVFVTDTFSGSVPQCEYGFSTSVTEIMQPIVEANVVTDAFSNSHIIEVSVLNSGGIYEYSLDGGPWQESSIFPNVNLGEHSVAVRDIRGCLEGEDSLVAMGYPRYFTPNGDGFNETWNITAPRSPIDYLASARVTIFDRYGKLLKEIDPTGDGWNGIYNGALMNTDDYWFVVEYIEPRTGEPKTFRSNFTLKR